MPTARGKIALRKEKRRVAQTSKSSKNSKWRKYFKFFLLGVFIFGLFQFTQTMYSSWKNRIWLDQTRLTVVVASEDPIVYSYDPQSQKLVEFTVPKTTEIEAVGGYGNWMAGSLWKLGEQEGKEGDLLRLSLQKSLGIPVDAYVSDGGQELFSYKSLGFLSASFEAFNARKLDSNLTFFDRVQILLTVSKLGVRDRRELDLTSSGVLFKKKLADGEAGYGILTERAKVTLESLRDSLVFEEEKKIVISNASGKSGIANEAAQIGSVLGVRVIGTNNSQESFEGCRVIGTKENIDSLSAKRLQTIFSCEIEEKEASGAADLELILGKEVKGF